MEFILDILAEFLFDIFLESALDASFNSSLPRFLRYGIIGLLIVFYAGLLYVIISLAVREKSLVAAAIAVMVFGFLGYAIVRKCLERYGKKEK